MVHFRREKFVPRGGPDGGDGGRGGDVILEVKPTLHTLSPFRPNQLFAAQDGSRGGSANKTGRDGEDLVIFVPPGTMIYDAESEELLADLTRPGQRLTVCRGGRGGRGNQHFATSRNQAPRTAERGEPSQSRRLRLELKLIADIGIIGVPNAGKSTLLAALTNAHPRIAPYPFTTLEPNLGVATLDDETRLVLADIPGLIEGASHGAGLGHGFLRHIQRTRLLIHLLDGLSSDPLADFSQINSELALFDPHLAGKPQIVALNKIDRPEVQERAGRLEEEFRARGLELMTISALARIRTRQLLLKAAHLLEGMPVSSAPEAPLPVYRPPQDARQFTVAREGHAAWRVSGTAIERAAAMTYWQHEGSLRRFQKLMERLGVDEALRKAGIKAGDTVYIGEFELEWQE